MATKLTRREAAAAALSASVALAQPPVPSPALPANSDEELKAARALLRDNAEQMERVPLPMPTEPAVHFKP